MQSSASRVAVRAIRDGKVSFRMFEMPRRDLSDATSSVLGGEFRVLRGHTYKWEFASERWHVISIVELQKSERQNSFDSIA